MGKHITVIGAGIVGIATACYLRRDGHDVTVVDERPPGQYCSFGNAGILSPGSCVPQALPGILWKVPGYLADPSGPLTVHWAHLARALPWFMKFVAVSRIRHVVRTADALRALLKPTFEAYEPLVRHAGVADLIHRTGYMAVYTSDRAYHADALAWKLRRDRGVVIKEFSAAAIKRVLPMLARNYRRGLYLPEQGYVASPERLTKALAIQFQRDGGRILQRKVLDIKVSPAGPTSLVTNVGSLPVENLVICAGVHSGELASAFGESLPVEAERGYHVTFPAAGLNLPMPVFAPEAKVFVTPMEMGLRIAGQAEFAGIYAEPRYARADVLTRHVQRMLPGIKVDGATKWMGRRPSMPDSLPVIGPSAKVANVYYAFGHGHVGLCGAAPTGRIIADLIAGRQPAIDVSPYRVQRFG